MKTFSCCVIIKIYSGVTRPDPNGNFRADANADMREQENYCIRYIGILDITITTECGYQMLVTTICNGSKISHILTNFIPNINFTEQ